MKNIDDIFGTDCNGNKTLIGKVYYESERDFSKFKHFYIGWEFAKEDILFNETNRRNIGIRDLNDFRRDYAEKGAVGVIYFPQTNTYTYKMPYDTVIQWEYGIKDEEAERALMEEIDIYANKQRKLLSRINEIMNSVDDADPLLELYDVPLSRKTSHSGR